MSSFCASRIREGEKDTHTHQRERERKERRNCQHRSLAGEKERERENQIWIGKNRLEAAQKERERFARDKQKQRRRKDALKRTVFSSESSSLSLFFFEKRWRLGVKRGGFDDVLRARTVARKRRKRSELPCSLGFRTLNHSIRKSLLKAVGNAKEEHTRILGESERAFHF